MKKLLNYIKHPSELKEWFFYFKTHGKRGRKLSDKEFISLTYKHKTGKEINLDSPKSFNEKLQWLKLHDRNPMYTDLCDKIKAKDIVEKLLGKEYIVPTLGVYNDAKEISFDKLPNKFVLKCNHDSGSVIVCRDKKSLNYKKTVKSLNKDLKLDYYLQSREWPYKDIDRKIFAEEYIEMKENTCMIDYKFYCFDGVPKFLYVSQGLEDHSTAGISFFDLKGNRLPFKRNDYREIKSFFLPNNFSEMLKIAEKLARFSTAKFIRIDLYTTNGKIYFSEFTFFPCGGFTPFEPKDADDQLGEMIEL